MKYWRTDQRALSLSILNHSEGFIGLLDLLSCKRKPAVPLEKVKKLKACTATLRGCWTNDRMTTTRAYLGQRIVFGHLTFFESHWKRIEPYTRNSSEIFHLILRSIDELLPNQFKQCSGVIQASVFGAQTILAKLVRYKLY